MKKLLLASAALALSAGFASAQGVSLSGDARMGMEYNDSRTTANVSDWQFTSRARVTFTLSGQSDTGLNFGASFRADQNRAAGVDSGNIMTGGTVFISGAFGRLTMGDAAGAARHNVGDLAFTSLTGIGDWNEMQYLDRLQQGDAALFRNFEVGLDEDNNPVLVNITDRRTAARYDYSIDGFTVSVSLDQLRKFNASRTFLVLDPDGGQPIPTGELDCVAVVGEEDGDPVVTECTDIFQTTTLTGDVRARGWAIGGSYDFGMGKISAGYEELRFSTSGLRAGNFTAGHFILGAEGTFEGITLKGIYGRATGDLADFLDADRNTSRDQYGVSVSGSFDEVTVSAFYNRDFFKTDKYGIGASYNLGGGARIVGSIAQTRRDVVTVTGEDEDRVRSTERFRNTRADFGVAFTF